MVRRFLKLFHRELSNVREAAFLLAAATIASNGLALVRDRLLASRFGAGIELDIYYAAFRIPDILYTLSLFFVASTAIIPLFLDRLSKNQRHAHEFMQTVFIAFLGSMGILVLAAYSAMPMLVSLVVPGFDADARQEVIHMARILLISPLFLGFSGLISSILQSFRRFFVYAASFLFYNIGIIFGIVVFVPRWGLDGLAWGVVVGALLHAGIQLPSIIQAGYFPRITISHIRKGKQLWADLIEIFSRSFPRTLGLAATQGAFLAITAIASTLGAGSIAVFQLSYNLQSIPLAVIGLSYSVAAFPTMAELVIKKERAVFFDHLISTARHIVFWTLPITVLFIVLRAHIVRVILGAGVFSWVDTRLTAASLALFALGIVAQSLSALFVRAFYAIANTRIPVIVNSISMIVTILLAVFFVYILQTEENAQRIFAEILRVDAPQSAVLALPLAFSLGALLNVVLLGLGFRNIDGGAPPMRSTRELPASAAMSVAASILLGVVAYGVLQITAPVFDLNRFWGVLLHGFLAGACGIVTAAFVLYMVKNKELAEVYDVMRHRFWQKTETIGLEQDHL